MMFHKISGCTRSRVGGTVNSDPKLLLAGLCLLVLSFVLAMVMRQLRRRRFAKAAARGSMMAAGGMVQSASPQESGRRHLIAPRSMMAVGGMGQPAHASAPRESNGHKVVAIIHDFGHPRDFATDERRYLSTREAFEILAEIRSVPPDKPIDVVLHTPGGEAFACELIASALKDRPNTTAYVPYCAMSAGTIIALATEKIVMGKYACLGPIDTQFYGFPIESYTRLLKEKPIQNVNDEVVLLAYLAEKELKTARQRACELLNKNHFGRTDACELTDFLVSGDMPHSEQINRERAIEFGVNIVNGECPPAVYDLVEERMKIFKSMEEQGGFGPAYQQLPAVVAQNRLPPVAPKGMWLSAGGFAAAEPRAANMASRGLPEDALGVIIDAGVAWVKAKFGKDHPITVAMIESVAEELKRYLNAKLPNLFKIIEMYWDFILSEIKARFADA